MKTTYSARWGSSIVSVCADWAQASCPVEGDDHGRQVADFEHSPWRALRAQLEECARIEGMSEDEAELPIAKAMTDAWGGEGAP